MQSTGEGTFGVVLQAKAEDIAKSAPHRNIVAVKTPRGNAHYIIVIICIWYLINICLLKL